MTRNNDGIFGGNGGNWFIVLILFFLGMGGNVFGNNYNNGAFTRAELYDGLNSQNTFSEFRSVQSMIDNGFAGTQLGIAGINQNMCAGFNGVQSAIADSNYRMADCCCQIKNAIHSEGEETRNLIQQTEIQKLRDALQDTKNEVFATGLTTAQIIQTNTLENFIRSVLPTTTPTA